ncbi:hypothetical protein U14_01062 [Candidatus Moduliflexus flocculans]|uniref:Uncharacterized protein n=1 Tax=Candidatus Moduliflexus flocculans TaxID=1499966 RepID=A0A0S6VY60_9BACT|nr:hypothetical protein U14_01062 [Candidatus Moduliflexus flocculans]
MTARLKSSLCRGCQSRRYSRVRCISARRGSRFPQAAPPLPVVPLMRRLRQAATAPLSAGFPFPAGGSSHRVPTRPQGQACKAGTPASIPLDSLRLPSSPPFRADTVSSDPTCLAAGRIRLFPPQSGNARRSSSPIRSPRLRPASTRSRRCSSGTTVSG